MSRLVGSPNDDVIDVTAADAAMKMVLPEEIAAQFKVGDDIDVAFDPKDLHIFDPSTGARMGDRATQ